MTVGQRPSPEFLALQAAVTGRYVLDREIGRGGMGVVFLARDVALERAVAIKLLLPHLADDPALRERFLREARTAAQLMHPNIVPIYAVEATDALVFFVMGYIEGETLAQRVQRAGPLPYAEVLGVTKDVAWALAYAHGRGVIHRDIKPDNILIESESGRALVADFGIARVTSSETLTDDGAFIGTVEYMSREQASALPVDGRSDVYSLAATLYFALLGESPVRAASLPAALGRLMQEESPNPALVRPDLPATFSEMLGRALTRDREHRLPSAEALLTELRSFDRAKPAVRPELKAYLSNVDSFTIIGTAGLGLALIPTLAWEAGKISSLTRDGFLVVGLGLAALGALLLPSGLLALRAQGLSWRELVQGLESEAKDLLDVKRTILRSAFGRATATAQRRTRWLGIGVTISYAVFAFAAWIVVPDGRPLTFSLAMGACGIGVYVGLMNLRRGLLTPQAFERTRAAGEKPALHFRLLLWLARRPLVERWWKRGETAAAAKGAVNQLPTATLLLQRVADLVRELPPGVRRDIPDVLQVAAGLELACSTLRARIERFDAAMAEVSTTSDAHRDFAAARRRLVERLADGVAALDAVRTDLLRLSVGLRDGDGLTLALEKAKELSAAIDAELHGQAEVQRLLG